MGACCNVVQWWIRVNSRLFWVKGVFWSHRLSVCPYICLPVCCLTWCFGAPFSLRLLSSLSDTSCLLHRGTSKNMEEKVVYSHRQLPVLLWVHHSEYSSVYQIGSARCVFSMCIALTFTYFIFVQDKEPRGIIPLENLSIRVVEDKKPVSAAPFSGLFFWLRTVTSERGFTFYSTYFLSIKKGFLQCCPFRELTTEIISSEHGAALTFEAYLEINHTSR